jgi:hypothetical protein
MGRNNDDFTADFGKNSVDAMLKMEKWRDEGPGTETDTAAAIARVPKTAIRKRPVKKENKAGVKTIPWSAKNGN